MLSYFLVTLLACGPTKKNTTNNAQNTPTTPTTPTNDPVALIEFDGVKNIILVDENEQRIEIKDATEGVYDAIAVFTVKDGKGIRDEEMRLEKITLSKFYTLKINCKWDIIDTSSAELKCDINKIKVQ